METVDGSNDRLRCTTCGKQLSSSASLLEHQRTHTGERPHCCNVCNKRFTQRAHLIIHKRTHTGEKPYACHICHKRFAQSSHLNGHKRIHTGEKPYSCTICKMGFCRKQRLEQHIQQHMLEDGGPAWPGPDQVEANSESAVFPETIRLDVDGGDKICVSPLPLPTRRRKPAFVRKMETESDLAGVIKTEVEELDEDAESLLSSQAEKWLDGKLPTLPLTKSPVSDGGNQPVFPSSQPYSSIHKDNSHTDTVSLPSEHKFNIKTTDDTDNVSVTSDSNHSSSDMGIPSQALRQSLLAHGSSRPNGSRSQRSSSNLSAGNIQSMIRTNSRISLVDFSADDLIRHMMSRDDILRCDFCCVMFQDAAMYHLHRSMHDKMDCRCCNICGKLLKDKYDFTAHFLSEHRH